MKRSLKILYILVTFAAITLFIMLGGRTGVRADGEFSFEKSKYTYYEGNESTLNLRYNNVDFFQSSDDFLNALTAYLDQEEPLARFVSSDESIVRVDDHGNITCVGTGTAQITAYYWDNKAECTIRVKKGKLSISEDEVELYSDQLFDVKLSGVKGIVGYEYEIGELTCSDEYSYVNKPTVFINGKGKFTIKAGKKGDYIIRLIAVKKNGVRYSKNIYVYTIETGPLNTDLPVAIGCSSKLEMTDSQIVSADLVKWYIGNYDFYPEDGEEFCPIKYTGNGYFSVDPEAWSATAIYNVYFETDDGTVLSSEVIVTANNPEYIPFGDYLWVGKTYEPNITDLRSFSKVVVTSSNSDIVKINDKGKIVPLKGGKVTLTIWVDGREFSEEVEVADVGAKGCNLLTWPGCSFNFKVSGVPEGLTVSYSSSNEDVATISKKGKLKALSCGFSMVTITIGEEEFHYTVNVGYETPIKAVLAAEEVVGKATYSQARRMEEGFYDCSSLAWRSYAKAGLKIKNEDYAPTAADLAKYLDENGYTISYEALPAEEMLPGDLIFSSSGGNNGRFMRIDHVAMYYSTNINYEDTSWYDRINAGYGEMYGSIVHAGSSGGGVYISNYPGYSNIVLIARIKEDE